MCLQWCHVRGVLVDNDIACEKLCPPDIRLAQREKRCTDCRHHEAGQIGLCLLTNEITPLAETCCHWNAPLWSGAVRLVLGETVPVALAAAHGVESTAQIFEMVDTAPELAADTPEEGIVMEIEAMAVPLVYGVVSLDWDAALYPSLD